MSQARIALLPDRGVVSVTGADAGKLLQGVLTNDLDGIGQGRAMLAGLLSPQGKILFDFLVVPVDDGYLLDVARDKAADLLKRLSMYRLRAKAELADVSGQRAVAASWGASPGAGAGVVIADLRHAALGKRIIADPGAMSDFAGGAFAGADDYHAHRIALGVPEGGKDYDFGDAFVHEANFDLLGGVSFEKGCYVGQEIVARMEHRGTVRKRVVRVTAASELPSSRPDVVLGDVAIGRLGSVAGPLGLAMLRLDRAIEAIDKGIPLTADGIALAPDPAMITRQRELMAQKDASR